MRQKKSESYRPANEYFTRKMFRQQFAPAMVSSVGLALGDMADAVVVGQQMGVTGLAAISLSLPVFMIINVLMHGLGIGGSIRFSTLLAEGEKKAASQEFKGILLTGILISGFLAAAGNLFMGTLLTLLGASSENAALYEASKTYVRIIISGMPLFFIAYILNYYLRNDDEEKKASIGFTAGNLSDIALNIILVLFCGMGVTGAAVATLAGQLISICCYLPGVLHKEGNLRGKGGPVLKNVFKCFCTGFSSSVEYLYTMLFILISNHVLLRISGSNGVAVFEMIQNASYLIIYLYDGTAKAMQPILSTYFGEKNKIGLQEIKRNGYAAGMRSGAVAIILVFAFPGIVCSLFGLIAGDVLTEGVYALRVYCVGAAFAGMNMIKEICLQTCGREKEAGMLATLRGVVFRLPLVLIFAFGGNRVFWWLFPASEILTWLSFSFWQKFKGRKEVSFDEDRVCTRILRSTNQELMFLIDEITVFCEKWEATAKQNYFVVMTIEEICAAIMMKGFVDTEGYIQVTLVAERDGNFKLSIRDNAVSFNPLTLHTIKAGEEGEFDMDAMGMLVVRQKAKVFFYRRYQGFNVLVVQI